MLVLKKEINCTCDGSIIILKMPNSFEKISFCFFVVVVVDALLSAMRTLSIFIFETSYQKKGTSL